MTRLRGALADRREYAAGYLGLRFPSGSRAIPEGWERGCRKCAGRHGRRAPGLIPGRPAPAPAPATKTSLMGRCVQVADLWLPRGSGPHPTVLMVHGGCWHSSIADRTIMNWIAADLRGRGIAVWNIDFRGVDRPGGGYPGTYLDAAAAVDALRSNAARYSSISRVDRGGAFAEVISPVASRPVRLPQSSALRPITRCRSTRSSASADCRTWSRPRDRPAVAAEPR